MKLYSDMVGDSRFLHDLGCSITRYGFLYLNTFTGVCNEVTAAWSKFGISVSSSITGMTNYYYLNGQEISRNEAMRRACQLVGKNIADMNFTDY